MTTLADRRVVSEGVLREYDVLRDVMDCLPVAIQIYEVGGDGGLYLVWANWSADHLFGVSHNLQIGRRIAETYPTDLDPEFMLELRAVAGDGATLRTDSMLFRNESLCLALEVHAFRASTNRVGIAFVDVTERERTEQTLRKLSQAVEHSPAIVIVSSADGTIEYVNPKFTEVTGYGFDEVVGTGWYDIRNGFSPLEGPTDLWPALEAGLEWRGELSNAKKSRESYWEYASISPIKRTDGTIVNYVAVKEDITLHKEYEQKLLRQANYDELTGLPNRLLACDRLAQALLRAERDGHGVAVGFVDLDDFKNINDTLGHVAGDQLLIETARRIRETVRASDTVGRLGGDEFLLVFPDLHFGRACEVVAEKILEALSKPFRIFNHEMFISASIGLTVFPDDGRDPDALLRNADTAMYRAKQRGKNTFQFFAAEMNENAVRRLRIETALRSALENGEIYLVFQPLVAARSGELVGAEALLRWQSRDLGAMMPGEFIAVAEQTGMIVALGEFVIERACRECALWRQELGLEIRIAVNVSARQLRGGRILEVVDRAIAATEIRPHQLEIEITERAIVEDNRETMETIASLRRRGVRICIDDFGTEYSSLSYLRRLPVHGLKIDRSFVRDLPGNRGSVSLTRAIITMAHGLGLEVVGEGVETVAQRDFLARSRSDVVQGYLISYPLNSAAFLDFARAWRARPGGAAGWCAAPSALARFRLGRAGRS